MKKYYLNSNEEIACIIITQKQIIAVTANSNINHQQILDKVLELISESNDKIPFIMIYCRKDIFSTMVNNYKGIIERQYKIVEVFYSMLLEIKDKLDTDTIEQAKYTMESLRDGKQHNLKNEQEAQKTNYEKIIGLPITNYKMEVKSKETEEVIK